MSKTIYEFIIVWRNTHREPFIDLDAHEFREVYNSPEAAKEAAEVIIKAQGPSDPDYRDYQIYQAVEV